jgi:hypothetical protein
LRKTLIGFVREHCDAFEFLELKIYRSGGATRISAPIDSGEARRGRCAMVIPAPRSLTFVTMELPKDGGRSRHGLPDARSKGSLSHIEQRSPDQNYNVLTSFNLARGGRIARSIAQLEVIKAN